MVESVENGPEGLYCTCKKCKSKHLLRRVGGEGEAPRYEVMRSIIDEKEDN